VPDWLSKIGETDQVEEGETSLPDTFRSLEDPLPPSTADEFETSDSWLDQISEKPPEASRDEITARESEVVDWLDDMDDGQDEPIEESPSDQLDPDFVPDTVAPDMVEPEPADTLPSDDIPEEADDLPDWLAELKEDVEESLTLEDAIRQSEHDLNDAEVDFLSRVEEKQEEDSDWLSKLDQADSSPDSEEIAPPIDLESLTDDDHEDEFDQDAVVSGGMLDRLRESSEVSDREDVPQWLADLKDEEDPQETAVLWLQQFINQGDSIDIQDEIKRYTDELDPGDSIPKWMEDLKNEEDPQTTAMLWLEKLSADRQAQSTPDPASSKEEDSGWLADLEREASESVPSTDPEEIKDFDTPDEGWLADLDIDEKLKTSDEEVPDWSKSEDEKPEVEPSWMKATSPLEGDFFTDELTGGEEKEVEIPEWLAGYAEGERPESEQERNEEDEYTWLSASDAPASRTPLDLNKAAISQLEAILGISHQIAKGIVSYREKNGYFKDFSDLMNVAEITDEQTIEILKPEVFISEIQLEEEPTAMAPPLESKPDPKPPKPKPVKKPSKTDNFEELLVTAKTMISDRQISEATSIYAKLVKKKKFLDEVIEDLQKASLDHPLEISIQKTLGDAFMQKDMLDQALEAYSKAEDLLS
jgi:tetratricopeptide (TPR) repeat protein